MADRPWAMEDLERMEPKRENFPDQESFEEAHHYFRVRTRGLMQRLRSLSAGLPPPSKSPVVGE